MDARMGMWMMRNLFLFDLNTLYGLLVCFPDQQKKGVENKKKICNHFSKSKKTNILPGNNNKNPEQIR